MKVTISSSITAKPSMCWPKPNSVLPLLHHVHERMTGCT
jgi:hypothetical protein